MIAYDVIEEAIRILLGGSREEMNKLDGAVSNDGPESTFTFKYALNGIREGAHIAIDDEICRVWSVDEGAKTAVVERGMFGSTALNPYGGDGHVDGALVFVNPRFPRFAVLKAMNDELISLSSPSNGLYRVDSYEFQFNAAVSDYELPEEAFEVYDVYADSPGPSQAWVRVPNWSWNPNADATDFANGKSIRIPNAFQGRTIRVVYKAAFTPITMQFEPLETHALLPVEMHDILSLGVLWRLGPSREMKRNFTEAQRGDARRAEEVPANAVQNSFAWARNQRQARITEERSAP
jgi:hypothetical protein